MRAGQLKEIITVLIPDSVLDDLHSQNTTWHDGFPTRAAVKTPGTSRTIDNAEIFFSSTAVFRVRIYHHITEQMRIRWRGDVYQIVGIERDEERRELIVKTAKVNEQGAV